MHKQLSYNNKYITVYIYTDWPSHKLETISKTRMWAHAQHYGHPAAYRWHPLLNAAKFG